MTTTAIGARRCRRFHTGVGLTLLMTVGKSLCTCPRAEIVVVEPLNRSEASNTKIVTYVDR
jgi:hypothetical protein